MAQYQFFVDDPSLGEGGYGVVFLCHEIEGGVTVNESLAVKLCTVGEFEDVDQKRERFRNGARLNKRLRHDNIMPVVEHADLDDGTPYIVMPRAEGGNLEAWLTRPHSEDEKLAIFRQILGAIAYAHGQNILHRDIKPSNVLFVNDVPVVSDFDLAKDIDPGCEQIALTRTNVGIGTEGYVAPEQWTDMKRVKPSADVYSLARLLWRIFSGRQPPHLSPIDLTLVPAQYRALIAKGEEYKATDRYGTAGEMLRAFDALKSAPPGSPKQVAQALVERWNGDEPDKHWKTLRNVDDHFQRHPDDESLHYELAPFLPVSLLDAWMEEHPHGFAQMVESVDKACAGSLPWDDCDVFATFYLRVFESSEDQALRVRAIEQVLRIGSTHNRYPVANMFRQAIEGTLDDASVEAVVEAAENRRLHAAWFILPTDVDDRIRQAFEGDNDAAAGPALTP